MAGNGLPDIELSNARIATRSGKQLAAAAHLRVRCGTLHAVAGPNGAGKTSLLRGIAGILPLTGSLTFGGTEVSTEANFRRTRIVGYQPQSRPEAEGVTAYEFVLSARTGNAGWLGGATDHDHEVTKASLERVCADGMSDRLLSSLSGGEAARVALASTLALETPWLLLDEPVAACDVAAARGMYQLLRRLIAEDHKSVLVVEHDLGLVRSFADEVSLLAGGELRATGPVADVFQGTTLSRVFGCEFRVIEAAQAAWAVVAVSDGVAGGAA